MKLREFIKQLQQLDQDAEVKIRTTDVGEDGDYSYEDPIIEVRLLALGEARYNSERRVVCIQ